jgi:hypothetical protein
MLMTSRAWQMLVECASRSKYIGATKLCTATNIKIKLCFAESCKGSNYAECSKSKCRFVCAIMLSIVIMDVDMLSVVVLGVVMLSVDTLNVAMLSVVKLSVLMLSVVVLRVMLSVVMLIVICIATESLVSCLMSFDLVSC